MSTTQDDTREVAMDAMLVEPSEPLASESEPSRGQADHMEHADISQIHEPAAVPEASTSGTSGSAGDDVASQGTPATNASAKAEPAIRVWKPVAPGTMPKPPELPESYYTPTAGQLKAAYAGQSNRLRQMGVDTNFSSRAAREKEERERDAQRRARWPKTIVRIRFHDRHQIETTFASTRTIEAVYTWVKSIFAEEVKKESFTLYVPPRIEYKLTDSKVAGKTLYDLQLAPSTVLLVKWQNTALNDANKVAPIRSDLLAQAKELPKPKSFDPTPEELAAAETQSKKDSGKPEEDGEKKGKLLGGGKAPKWLKNMGGNKK